MCDVIAVRLLLVGLLEVITDESQSVADVWRCGELRSDYRGPYLCMFEAWSESGLAADRSQIRSQRGHNVGRKVDVGFMQSMLWSTDDSFLIFP